MEIVGGLLVLAYFVGAAIVAIQIRRRAGIMHNRRLDLARDGVGPIWLVKGIVMTALWPITLLMWRRASSSRAR